MLYGGPFDPGHVAVVGYVGPVVGEDPGWCGVVFAEPCGAGVEDVFDGEA
jgi:hypothetical protein